MKSKLLCIETSTETCSIALHIDREIIGYQEFHLGRSHSELLPGIIEDLLTRTHQNKNDLMAVAVSSGPGSYTGLRIGASVAKALCLAWQKPLLGINSLDTMIEVVRPFVLEKSLLVPMIDARRMEVYCKVVDSGTNKRIWNTRPLVVEKTTFKEFNDQELIFFGNGSEKLKPLFEKTGIGFIEGVFPKASSMGILAFEKLRNERTENLVLYEPEYLKEFRTNKSRKKL